MDTWGWLAITGGIAAVAFALAWWSSGRSRPRGRGPRTSVTQKQFEETHLTSVRHRAGPPGG